MKMKHLHQATRNRNISRKRYLKHSNQRKINTRHLSFFAVMNLNKTEHGYFLGKCDDAENIAKLEKEGSNFRTTIHKLEWLVNTRPQITAEVSILSQVTNKKYKKEHFKTIDVIIKHATSGSKKGLKYKALDLDYLQLKWLSDKSFSGNEDGSSQVAYMIYLTHKHSNPNLVDYGSIKSLRVFRSVLVTATFA